MRISKATIIAIGALLLGPATLGAQQPERLDPAQLPPEAQELIGELQQLQMEIEPIQRQALEDPEIQAEQQALSAELQQAMAAADPSTAERIDRMESLISEAQAAQAEQDQERLAQIVMEVQQIEQQLQATQAEAAQTPEIQPRVERFQNRLRSKMLEVDPNAGALIERAQELDARLGEVLGQG